MELIQKQEDIIFSTCRNPFNRTSKDIKRQPYERKSLLQYKNENNIFPDNLDVIISVNGHIVDEKDWEFFIPTPGSKVVIVPKIEGGGGGGGKGLIQAIIGVVLIVVGVLTWYTPFGLPLVMMGAGMLLGGIVSMISHVPSIPGSGESTSSSQVYSWSPQTAQTPGLPIPKIYGTMKVYGNVIDVYVDNVNEPFVDKQWLNMLISLGMGPIKDIHDIQLNEQPIQNLNQVSAEVRYGRLSQPAVSYFNSLKTEYPLSIEIDTTTPCNYTTTGNDFDSLEVEVSWPNGLWYANDQGGLTAQSFTYKIELQKVGDSTWSPLTHQVVSTTGTISTPRWSLGVSPNDGAGIKSWMEYYSGSTSRVAIDPNDSATIYEGKPGNFVDGGGNKIYGLRWHWLIVGETYTTPANTVSTFTMTAGQSQVIRNTWRCLTTSGKGQYRIKITSLTPHSTDTRTMNDFKLTTVREVVDNSFTYPRIALAGIHAMATNQLSGSARFSCIVEGALVAVYDSTSHYTVEWSNNPAWVCLDVLTMPVWNDANTIVRYEGIDPSTVDIAAFMDWADFCDELVDDGESGTEKRCLFDGVFDTQQTVWENALTVAQTARAVLVYQSGMLSVFVDKLVTTPVQLFSVGNIVSDSFKVSYMSLDDRITDIEIDFNNKDDNYDRDNISLEDKTINPTTNKTTIQLIGVTRPSQAWREANYRLLCNKYLQRTIDFDADIDAIACTVGDVVRIQHDSPEWGDAGGRIVSATNSPTPRVTLDKSVVIDSTSSYQILVRLNDESGTGGVITKGITNAPGTYTTLTVDSSWSEVPTLYNVYAFGKLNYTVRDYRIIVVSKKGDQTVSLTGIEYIPEIYVDGTPNIPDYNPPFNPYVIISNLVLTEYDPIDENDNIRRSIQVTFDVDVTSIYGYAEIWYRNITSSNPVWTHDGNTPTTSYNIYDVDYNQTYEVMVKGVNAVGLVTPPPNPTAQITTTNIPDYLLNQPVPMVTGLGIDRGNNAGFANLYWDDMSSFSDTPDIKLVWNPLTLPTDENANEEKDGAGSEGIDGWLRDYEIKVYWDDPWGNLSFLRTEYVKVPNYIYTEVKNKEDNNGTYVTDFVIDVIARDKYGRKSNTSASIQISNEYPLRYIMPTGVFLTASSRTVVISWDNTSGQSQGKFTGYTALYEVHMSTVNGFTPGVSTLKYTGLNNQVVLDALSDTTYYVKLRGQGIDGSYSSYTTQVSTHTLKDTSQVSTPGPLTIDSTSEVQIQTATLLSSGRTIQVSFSFSVEAVSSDMEFDINIYKDSGVGEVLWNSYTNNKLLNGTSIPVSGIFIDTIIVAGTTYTYNLKIDNHNTVDSMDVSNVLLSLMEQSK